MGNATVQISYPAGISPALVAQLTAASHGADAATGKINAGMSTLTSVISDVSVVLNDIYTSSKGLSVQAMASFWDGAGSIGQGGLGTGGVISDASKALNFLNSLSGSMPGISGNINDQLAAVSSGISAIATVQANPGKKWTPAEASGLEHQIGNMMSALETINTALLSTANSIVQASDQVKLGGACASGVSIGQKVKPFVTGVVLGATGAYVAKKALSGRKSAGGGGAKPPEEPPPTGGSGDEEPSGESWKKKLLHAGRDAGAAAFFNLLISWLKDPNRVKDIQSAKWWEQNTATTFIAVLAGGLAGPFGGKIPGFIGKFVSAHGGATGTIVGGVSGIFLGPKSSPTPHPTLYNPVPGHDGKYTILVWQNGKYHPEELTRDQLLKQLGSNTTWQQEPSPVAHR